MDIDIEKYLKKTSLFNCLNSFQLARLGRAIAVKSYKKDALIFSEGDPASGFYIVAEGKVKVYKLSPPGQGIYYECLCQRPDHSRDYRIFRKKIIRPMPRP